MPSIAEAPDDPKYNIKAVSEQTGIPPVTLRAWERRYRLLKPRRTRGNYRLYSERDVEVLRWVKRRVDNGQPVSRAADEFLAFRRNDNWPAQAPAPPPAPTQRSPVPPAIFAQRLYAALVALDEAAAGAILSEANAMFDVADVCLQIAQPCLVEIGEAWSRGEVGISTEHFASQYLRGRLTTLFQSYPVNVRAPRVVVGCAPDEFHDIGSLMLSIFLRRAGYRVEFLGANVHIEDLINFVRERRPALICLSASLEPAVRGLRRVEQRLAALRPRPKFAFGGRIFTAKPALPQTVPGLYLGSNAEDAVTRVRDLLPL